MLVGNSDRWHSLIVVSSLVVLLLTGCGDDRGSERACLRNGEAEVCAHRESSGTVGVRGRALQPGSNIEATTENAGTGHYSVGADGEPEGSTAFINATPSSPLEVRVAAVAATGAALEGTLTIE